MLLKKLRVVGNLAVQKVNNIVKVDKVLAEKFNDQFK